MKRFSLLTAVAAVSLGFAASAHAQEVSQQVELFFEPSSSCSFYDGNTAIGNGALQSIDLIASGAVDQPVVDATGAFVGNNVTADADSGVGVAEVKCTGPNGVNVWYHSQKGGIQVDDATLLGQYAADPAVVVDIDYQVITGFSNNGPNSGLDTTDPNLQKYASAYFGAFPALPGELVATKPGALVGTFEMSFNVDDQGAEIGELALATRYSDIFTITVAPNI